MEQFHHYSTISPATISRPPSSNTMSTVSIDLIRYSLDVVPRLETSTPKDAPRVEKRNPIDEWDTVAVQQWLTRCELSKYSHRCASLRANPGVLCCFTSSLDSLFVSINGTLLWRLYQMKQSAATSYYTFLDRWFNRVEALRMSDTLRFDHELECLFSTN